MVSTANQYLNIKPYFITIRVHWGSLSIPISKSLCDYVNLREPSFFDKILWLSYHHVDPTRAWTRDLIGFHNIIESTRVVTRFWWVRTSQFLCDSLSARMLSDCALNPTVLSQSSLLLMSLIRTRGNPLYWHVDTSQLPLDHMIWSDLDDTWHHFRMTHGMLPRHWFRHLKLSVGMRSPLTSTASLLCKMIVTIDFSHRWMIRYVALPLSKTHRLTWIVTIYILKGHIAFFLTKVLKYDKIFLY